MTSTTTGDLIAWSDHYSVGIPRIDAEHRRLMDLVNELHRAIHNSKQDPATSEVLDALASYTITHFTGEEGLMKRHAYPEYAQHKAEHDKLVAQVRALQQEARAGKPVSRDVMSFLSNWLTGHILAVDRKYRAHMTAAGAK